MLQLSLFPVGVVPTFYPPGLAISSARAAVLLRTVEHAGTFRSRDWMVKTELAATYYALMPNRVRRRVAFA